MFYIFYTQKNISSKYTSFASIEFPCKTKQRETFSSFDRYIYIQLRMVYMYKVVSTLHTMNEAVELRHAYAEITGEIQLFLNIISHYPFFPNPRHINFSYFSRPDMTNRIQRVIRIIVYGKRKEKKQKKNKKKSQRKGS